MGKCLKGQATQLFIRVSLLKALTSRAWSWKGWGETRSTHPSPLRTSLWENADFPTHALAALIIAFTLAIPLTLIGRIQHQTSSLNLWASPRLRPHWRQKNHRSDVLRFRHHIVLLLPILSSPSKKDHPHSPFTSITSSQICPRKQHLVPF